MYIIIIITIITMSSAVPEKWIHSQDKIDLTFSLDSNLGVHSPYDPDCILPPVTFGLFFLNRRSGWQDGSLPGSRTSEKPYVISELNAIPASVYQHALQMWLRRLQIGVASGEMYSEGS